MTLVVGSDWATACALLSIRWGAVLLMTPLLPGFNGPPAVIVLLSLVLAGLFAASSGTTHAMPASLPGFVWAALTELVVGALLAFGVHAAFAAFGMAGQVIDLQLGFGIGNVFDPVSRTNTPMIGALMNLLGVAVFFAIDGHHALLRGIAFSVEQLQPGTGLHQVRVAALVRQFGMTFSLAAALAMPVMATLLLVDVGLGVMSRVLPQMNVYFVGLPLKLLVGLAAIAISVRQFPPVMGRVYVSIFRFWTEVLR